MFLIQILIFMNTTVCTRALTHVKQYADAWVNNIFERF